MFVPPLKYEQMFYNTSGRFRQELFTFTRTDIHVYERIGFKREGVLRDALYWQGEYVDAIIMSVLTHEWDA